MRKYLLFCAFFVADLFIAEETGREEDAGSCKNETEVLDMPNG